MQSPSSEELNAVTLQIGLVGNDGLVMASDRLLQQIGDGGARSVGKVSKFLRNDGTVMCWAGDSIAERAAIRIEGLDWNSVKRNSIAADLMRAGDATWEEMERLGYRMDPGVIRNVLVAFRDDFWQLEVGLPRSLARRRIDRVVMGDPANSARFLINRYANEVQMLPTSQLVSLAAYAILMGGEENPNGVGGLEVVVIPKGGLPRFSTTEQEQELAKLSESLDDVIKEQLLTAFDM